jgi:UDP-N-acetylmuramate dehydrogenase
LKGYAVGGACVSERHANFIVNRGGASAADIETLIDAVRERVEAVHGVALIPEVRIVGEARFGAAARSRDDG